MAFPWEVEPKYRCQSWSLFTLLFLTISLYVGWSIVKMFKEPMPVVTSKHNNWGYLPNFWICPSPIETFGVDMPVEIKPTNFTMYHANYARDSSSTSWSNKDISFATMPWNQDMYKEAGIIGTVIPEFNGIGCAYFKTSGIYFDTSFGPLHIFLRAEFSFPNATAAMYYCSERQSQASSKRKLTAPSLTSTPAPTQIIRSVINHEPRPQTAASPEQAKLTEDFCYFGATLIADAPQDTHNGFEPWAGEVSTVGYWGYMPPVLENMYVGLTKKVLGEDYFVTTKKHPEYDGQQKGIIDLDPRLPGNAKKGIMFSLHVAAQSVPWDMSTGRLAQIANEVASIGGYITIIGSLFGLIFVHKHKSYFDLTLRGDEVADKEQEDETEFAVLDDGDSDNEREGYSLGC